MCRTFQLIKGVSINPNKTHMQKAAANLPRLNPINIQMLSATLQKQLFKDGNSIAVSPSFELSMKRVKEHLSEHSLWGKDCTVINDVELNLPPLSGENIEKHFETIARNQSELYFDIAQRLSEHTLPGLPKEWILQPGWTKYSLDGSSSQVQAPEEDGLIFDVEVCLSAGQFPVLATTASSNNW